MEERWTARGGEVMVLWSAGWEHKPGIELTLRLNEHRPTRELGEPKINIDAEVNPQINLD